MIVISVKLCLFQQELVMNMFIITYACVNVRSSQFVIFCEFSHKLLVLSVQCLRSELFIILGFLSVFKLGPVFALFSRLTQ